MVATCAGYILARIRSIAEIMGNNLDVHRHRRLTYIEQARPDKAGRRDSG
jgi:abnormal spindle-like microcephaly-associated protein